MTQPPLPRDATLADIGEFGLISRFDFPQSDAVFLGPGDDAAVVRTRSHVVVSVDMAVEGRHFRRDWASGHDIGRKVAAAALADISAMGGVAHSMVVALGVPTTLSAQWALDLAAGIGEEAGLAGASVVGGDVTQASQVVISVTVMGGCELAPVTRAGARVGDVVALRGRQGWAAAGLAVLSRGFRSPRAAVAAYARPEPPYAAGLQAAHAGATAMIDISDGLVSDLGHIAEASGVCIDIDSALLSVDDILESVGAALGIAPLTFVLGGGDDHPLAACFAHSDVPEGWVVIGRCVAGAGVLVDGAQYDGAAGFTHF